MSAFEPAHFFSETLSDAPCIRLWNHREDGLGECLSLLLLQSVSFLAAHSGKCQDVSSAMPRIYGVPFVLLPSWPSLLWCPTLSSVCNVAFGTLGVSWSWEGRKKRQQYRPFSRQWKCISCSVHRDNLSCLSRMSCVLCPSVIAKSDAVVGSPCFLA